MIPTTNEALVNDQSAVSWGAILAGSAASAALSLALLILGVGLGLSVVSPWANSGASATTISISAIIWLTLSALIAAAVGGYLAGRLRTKWTKVHTDEVYFRDTAHGFLTWAISLLLTAMLWASVMGSIVSGTIQAGASVAGGVATTTATALTAGGAAAGTETGKPGSDIESMGMDYFIDSLFRKDLSTPSDSTSYENDTNAAPTSTDDRRSVAEVSRIFMKSIQTGNLETKDSRYVSQIVAQHTGLTQEEAEKRVRDTYARIQKELKDAETAVKEAADEVREVSVYTSLWMFISLLASAFIASLAATYGGRQRQRDMELHI
jgi:hypothetical protein